jgi:RNA polymerase sigma-70 factor (ECF subfamily)
MPLSDTALQRLVADHRRFLGFLSKRAGSTDVAEEILQAAFAWAVEKRDTVRDDESAVAWFYRLLRNALSDHFRHGAAERRALERQPGDVEVSPTVAVDEALEQAACQCVLAAAESLKPEYSAILQRVDVQGEPVEAVARDMKLSPGNGRVRLHRARRALRRQVEMTCRTCAEHGCMDCSCRPLLTPPGSGKSSRTDR